MKCAQSRDVHCRCNVSCFLGFVDHIYVSNLARSPAAQRSKLAMLLRSFADRLLFVVQLHGSNECCTRSVPDDHGSVTLQAAVSAEDPQFGGS